MVEDTVTHSGIMIMESGVLLNPATELGHWEYWGTPPTGVFIPNAQVSIPRLVIDNIVASLSEDRSILNVNMEGRLTTPINYVKVDVVLEPVQPSPLIDLGWDD